MRLENPQVPSPNGKSFSDVFLLKQRMCICIFCLKNGTVTKYASFWLATASFDVYVVKRFSPELIEW